MNTGLRIGVTVREMVTGFEGTVTRKMENLSGFTQWCVTPPSVDNTYPDGTFLDPHTLEVTGEGVANLLTPPEESPELKLGAKVKDKYSDFTGFIVSRIYEMNGCMQLVVSSPQLQDGKIVCEGMSANSLVVVEEPKVETTPKRTGPAPRRSSAVGRSPRC